MPSLKDIAKQLIGPALGMFIIFLFARSCDKPPAQQVDHNRVPTVSQQIAEAQAAADQAKASAAVALKAQQDTQAAVEKLNAVQRDSDGNLKEGRPEQSGVGSITEFSKGYFLFVQKDGFTKKFEPLCGDPTIPAGRPVIFNYHWVRGNPNTTASACYSIDSWVNQ